MHKKEVVIIGMGGHGKVIADIIKASGDIVAGFLDDGIFKESKYSIFFFCSDCAKMQKRMW